MQSIDANLTSALLQNAQRVLPYVEAEWVNGRSLRNVVASSSSDDYVEFVKSLLPAGYYRLNDSFDFFANAYTGPKPVTHWRFNNIVGSAPIASGSSIYPIKDECSYINLNMIGTPGSHFTFGGAGVVQDNYGNRSISTAFSQVIGPPFVPGYGLSNSADTDNRWSIVDNPNFSIETWFNPSSSLSNNQISLIYKTGVKGRVSTPEWFLSLDNTDSLNYYPTFTIFNQVNNAYEPLSTGINVYAQVKSSVAATKSGWNHLVVTFDGRTLMMYLNNDIVATSTTVNGQLADLASGIISVGAKYLDYLNPPAPETSPVTNFLGSIDEILIYNDTLSASDINTRWKAGSLNVASRTSASSKYFNVLDYSGKGRNGFVARTSAQISAGDTQDVQFVPTDTNGLPMSPLSGRIDGGAVKFVNASSLYSNISGMYMTSDNTSTGTTIFSGNNITVSAWIYLTAANTGAGALLQEVAGMGDGTILPSNRAWYLMLSKSGSSGPITISGNVCQSGTVRTATSGALALNTWHHVVMTVNSANQVILMVNGDYATAEANPSASTVTTMNTNAAWPTSIGFSNAGQRLTDTLVSEVSIFNQKTDIRAWAAVYKAAIATNNVKNVSKFYDVDQVINGQKEHTVTWAVLDALDENGNVITANGDYFISERSETLQVTDYEYGWWSKHKSDGSGNFSLKPTLYITFNDIYASHIDLFSATKYGRIKSGNIYYRTGSVWQPAVPFTLTSSSTSVVLAGGGAVQINAIMLIIDSTQYPNDVARVQEFSPRWTEVLSNENSCEVVSMDISKTRENNDSSVPLGATASNTCSIVLDNTPDDSGVLRFNPEETGSDLYGLIGPGVKFTVGYVYETSGGYRTIQQGVFYADTWGVDTDNMTINVSTRDYSARMQDGTIVDGYLATDLTASEAIAELATRAGVPLSKLDIDFNYRKEVMSDRPNAYWRMDETRLEPFSLFFNGSTYLYSHPFADPLAGSGSVSGTKKDTTVAARNVLPRTFYDFPFSEATVEFWIKASSSANGKTILNFATKRFANELRVMISSTGNILTHVQNNAPSAAPADPAEAAGIASTQAITDGIWHHVAIVLDPSAAGNNQINVKYIIDGVDSNNANLTFNSPFRPSGQFLMGAGFTASVMPSTVATAPHTLNTSSIFVGHLREVKIWNTAKTTTQIRNGFDVPYQNQKIGAYSNNIYKNMICASNPIAYWPLDTRLNPASTSAFIRDISGYDRNGVTNVAGMSSTTGPILTEDTSRGLAFGSAGSYITVTNASSGGIVTTNPFEGTAGGNAAAGVFDFSLFPNNSTLQSSFSAEFWVNAQSFPSIAPNANGMAVLSKYSAAGQREWIISLRNISGDTTKAQARVDLYNSGGGPAGSYTSDVNLPLYNSRWNHVVCTFSGSRIQFWINGKNAGGSNFPTGAYLSSNPTAGLRIGASELTGDNLINSSLAHVALYRRSLTEGEVFSHYSKAGYNNITTAASNDGRLAFYWPMNQGRFYSYEDLKSYGFAYTAASTLKRNIVPNITKFSNHMYAYTANTTSNPINEGLWKSSGLMAVKDSSYKQNYLTYRMGTSGDTPMPYNEMDSTKYVTFNGASPITSEVETSTKFSSANAHIAYMPHSDSIPMSVTSTTSVALEMWIKPSSVTTKQYLFARENINIGGTVAAGTWRIFLDSDGKVKFELFPTAGGAALAITPTGAQPAISANAWHHIVANISSNGTNYVVALTVDGTSYATYTWTVASGALTAVPVANIFGGSGLVTANTFDGYISNIAVYNRLLTAVQISSHYDRGRSLYQYVYPAIAVSSESYWSEMLKIATADVGMFFFDEKGNFVYEHGRAYDDTIDSQHAVVQYEINDGNYGVSTSNKALISATQNIDLQVNKVIVKVYPKQSFYGSTSGIWSAEGGTSLAICTLNSNLSSIETSAISLTLTLNPAGLYEPLWPDSGIVKINNEFIKYNKANGSTLLDLERGYWGSRIESHSAGSVVKEAREFTLEWSTQPVFFVKYPFITGVIYDKTLVASNWKFNGIRGSIRLYPSDNAVPSNRYIVVEGNNPVTKLDNFFRVAGYVIDSKDKNKQNIVEVSEDYKDSIRRYGEKVLEIDNPLIQDATYAKDLAQYLLKKYSNPVPVTDVKTIGLPHLQLGDRIKINELDRMSISNGEYWIMSISMSYNGGLEQTMTLRKVS